MGYWDDYIAGRPMTPGGEQRLLEAQRATNYPVVTPEPDISDVPALPETKPVKLRPPKIKRQLTKLDFLIGAIAFLVTWPMLAASSSMDGWTAIAFAFFACAIATMWWRKLLVVAVVGVVLLFLYHLK